MRTSRGNHHRNFRGNMQQVARSYGEVVRRVLQQQYGPLKCAAKYLARDARATPRAAENWLAGECAPHGQALIHLMAHCKELRAEIDRLIEETSCADG
jgi:hypothetical protein